ncbi:tyrosine-type recombinase/integrase [Streptococcus acidominimus]|uniref:Site-specific integrase n=1 Tax=Streptococcus acidominimus TaxID=1326 RepID=A0A4Y9FQD6_STRAI|nr:site-specific integrase [Streptococcus acidominimus]MBF0818964.1 site-specific integrase [Streptococcus acidominimus]MBF0837889.1 site-specific integrase [Streptococcus acidominimus]MBF0846068.1 site-specific integrase [Streptococcus danieliae]TFU30478.1 site-specific integrase [Streptococcus acidominimus]
MEIKEITKKNGSIVYRASVYLGVDQLTGKKARTTVTANTKKGVKVKAREAVNAFVANGHTTKAKPTITTYRELVALWWESYKHTVKPNTQLVNEMLIRVHLLPVFGDYKLSKITTPVIQQQVNKWANLANKGEKGAFSHYHMLTALNKRILQYAVTMQLIPYNPARDVIVPRKLAKGDEKIKYLDNHELKQFLAYLDKLDQSSYENLFDFVLYKFLLATGCRIGEALALEWSDIDLKNGTVSITKTLNRYLETNTPKSKAGLRNVEIDKATVSLLKQYKNRQQLEAWQLGKTETVIFSTFVSRYPCPSSLRKRLKRHFSNARVSGVGFHGFRHTHASIVMNAGIGYKELQHRLGHSTLAMTMDTYSHLSKENAKKAVSLFETTISNL